MSILKAGFDSLLATAAKLAGALIGIKIIASVLGPEGMGQVGQFMSIVAILAVVTSGATSIGVNRLVAQENNNRTALNALIGTVTWIIIISSFLAICITLVLAENISNALFGTQNYSLVLQLGCIFFIPLGFSTVGIAVINGLSETRALAIIQISSSVVGVLGLGMSVVIWREQGAIIGLLWMSSCQIIFIIIWWLNKQPVKLNNILSNFDKIAVQNLMKFSAYTLFGIIINNFSQIIIRGWLHEGHGWAEVGYWQAILRVSDAYLQVVNVFFAAYLLPKLVREKDIQRVILIALNMYRLIMPILFVLFIALFFFRDIIIFIFLSDQFYYVKHLFLPQMIGDFFKIAAFIPGYILIARGYMPLLFLGDPIQVSLLLITSSFIINEFGSMGAAWAYSATYILYAILSFSALVIIKQRFIITETEGKK